MTGGTRDDDADVDPENEDQADDARRGKAGKKKRTRRAGKNFQAKKRENELRAMSVATPKFSDQSYREWQEPQLRTSRHQQRSDVVLTTSSRGRRHQRGHESDESQHRSAGRRRHTESRDRSRSRRR